MNTDLQKIENSIPMKRKKLLLVVNPTAGTMIIKNKLLEVIDIFVKANYDVTVRTTQFSGEMPIIIQNDSKGFDLFVCCGGDGTLSEAIDGIITYNPDILFGYIPAGTINDFASSLSLPKNDPVAAAETIVNGSVFGYDIGVFDNKHFSYIAAFGAFTAVSYATSQEFKNIFGRAAYFLEGVKHLPSLKSYRMRIVTPEATVENDFIFGMVSNSVSVIGINLAGKYKVELNDGLLEILLIRKPKNAIELQSIVNALLLKDFSCNSIYVLRASHLQISSIEEISWTLDRKSVV